MFRLLGLKLLKPTCQIRCKKKQFQALRDRCVQFLTLLPTPLNPKAADSVRLVR